MEEHRFQLEAKWQGGRMGTGELTGEGLRTVISIPGQMGGPGVGSNPEELLIGSAMNCYIITLAAILERRGLPVVSLSLQSEGVVAVEGGSQSFRQIIHRPTIILSNGAGENAAEMAEQAAHRAEQACMISKALRGNVQFSVEPTVRRTA